MNVIQDLPLAKRVGIFLSSLPLSVVAHISQAMVSAITCAAAFLDGSPRDFVHRLEGKGFHPIRENSLEPVCAKDIDAFMGSAERYLKGSGISLAEWRSLMEAVHSLLSRLNIASDAVDGDAYKSDAVGGDAPKDDDGKLDWSLLPPDALEEVIVAYQVGVRKYGVDSWAKGMGWRRIFAAMMRHAWAWFRGENRDPDGQTHLAAVAWCALTLIAYDKRGVGTDDRPPLAPSQKAT